MKHVTDSGEREQWDTSDLRIHGISLSEICRQSVGSVNPNPLLSYTARAPSKFANFFPVEAIDSAKASDFPGIAQIGAVDEVMRFEISADLACAFF
jgi:hypothetical protein